MQHAIEEECAAVAAGTLLQPKIVLGQDQVAATGDGQELRDPLECTQENGLPPRHDCTRSRTILRLPTRRIVPSSTCMSSLSSVILVLSGPKFTPPCWMSRRASPLLGASLARTSNLQIQSLPSLSSDAGMA